MAATSGDAITIVPLVPERLDDLATLFDQPGDPKWCWCANFDVLRRVKGVPPAVNRAVLTERTLSGPPPGLIAYRDGRVVGWVNVRPRAEYVKLAHQAAYRPVDDRPVWSIVCFVVARSVRGQGIARDLLRAAIDHARANGATALEAYPVDADGATIPPGSAFRGTLSMFERAGFSVVARRPVSKAAPPRPIVRLEL